MAETFTFQAETQQILDILIHSLYTDREIFLRELISNASDALNRMQFEQLTNDDVHDPDAQLAIRITWDEEAGTLTVSDTGVGMTREDMIENLGTIAHSGAKNFITALQNAPNQEAAQNIIGQFGVGFYSVFMVAEKVRVVSRSFRPDVGAVAWESDGGTTYHIEEAERAARGTDVIVYMKEDAKEFLSEWKLKDIVKRHSDYVAFPIYIGDDEQPTNKQIALWRQSPSEVEEDEYNQFYRMLTMDFEEPLHRIHMRADVPMQFYALLFIPSTAEQNMFSLRREPGLKLYARKILIEEYNRDLLPEYLQFIQGVVDSEDLPLNVSRENVKADRIIARLQKTITNKVLSELKKLASDEREKYIQIFQAFGRYLKQGIIATPQDRDDLMELLYFNSSHDDNPESFHSLQDYIDRMVEGQEEIYYVIADDFSSARRSPHLEPFRQRGIEVLYFSDPVDAMLPMGLSDYRGRAFRAVDEGDIDLKDVGKAPEDEADRPEPLEAGELETLRERIQAVLGERVAGVRGSRALVGSPARLISDEGGSQRHMYRINRLLDRDYELPVKTLEINPRHPLTHNLSRMIQQKADSQLIDMVIEQIFETALLQDGIHPDPASMADRLTMLMQAATGGDAPTADGESPADATDADAAPASTEAAAEADSESTG